MRPDSKSDRTLILLTLLLLAGEILWLLMHLHMIPNPFKARQQDLQFVPAGHVVKANRELRKRRSNSLIWENAGPEEVLFYYDSVRTLSQSSATLNLQGQTELHLSENTLVTLEPQSKTDAQIRLRFTHGDLRARNPFAATRIESDSWSLNLSKGSEMSLRQTGEGHFEVEVLKGNLQFEKDSAQTALAENEILKIEDNKVGPPLKLSAGVQFEGPEFQRFYSFEARAMVPVQWKGSAQLLQISGKEKVIRTLEPNQTLQRLELEPGKYTLRLLHHGQVSQAKEIEVWQSPRLHLLSPFPRDRVQTHESISFVWSEVPEAQKYKFIITDLVTGQITEKEVRTHFFDFSFSEERPVQWKVIGIDRDGYEIPAPYANEIYPRHEMLQAPRLKNPELRTPASKKKLQPGSSLPRSGASRFGWLWIWLVPRAQAQAAAPSIAKASDYEAVFAWEAVLGADQYTIEISDTPDFRNPRLSKTVRRTEFAWSDFSLGTYFWRVAAGSSKGRMGVFSEPAKIVLEKLPAAATETDGILIRKRAKLEKEREPVNTRTEDLLQDVPQALFEEKIFERRTSPFGEDERQLRETYLLQWTPSWRQWTLNGSDGLKARLSGSTTTAGHFQTEQILPGGRSFFVEAFSAHYKWKAADSSQFPSQKDQYQFDGRLHVLFGNSKSSLLRGATVQMVPTLKQLAPERVEVHSTATLGPSVTYDWRKSKNWRSSHSLQFVAGSQVFAFSSQNQVRYLFRKKDTSALFLSSHLFGDVVFHEREFSFGFAAGLGLGFEN
jgi:hypothetical protein